MNEEQLFFQVLNKEQLCFQVFKSAQTSIIDLIGAEVSPDNFKT